jgi:tetratricopeptide (TPR) repeat protein/transglutaminase-like putative cysteine protease
MPLGVNILSLLLADAAVAELPAPGPAPPELAWRGVRATIDAIAVRAEAAARSTDPRALALLYRLWNFDLLLEETDRVQVAVERVRTSARDPILRAHATYLAAQLALRRGDTDEAKRRVAEIGLVTEAMVIGPFDNSAGRGHDTRWPPEERQTFDGEVPGKAHPVRWRPITGLAPFGVIELSEILHPSSEASAYVAFAVEASRTTDAAIRTGSVDQLRVFLGRRLLASVDARRAANLDQDAIAARIPKGRSLVLIKSSWTDSSGRLLVRLTKPDGAALEGVRVLGDEASVRAAFESPHPAAPEARHAVVDVASPLTRAIDRYRGRERADALALSSDLWSVLSLFDRRKLPTPPETALIEAIRLSPDDPSLRFFFGHRVGPREPALAREQLEAALASDPGFAPASMELGQLAEQAGRLVDARASLAASVRSDPELSAAQTALEAMRFDELEASAAAALALARAPRIDRSSLALVELARMYRALGDKQAAKRTAERALAIDARSNLARQIAVGVALDRGEVEEALTLVDRGIALLPHAFRLRIQKARISAGVPGRLADAIAVVDEARESFPDVPSLESLRAELLLFAGRQSEALASLDRSLELDPQQPDVRKHRRALSGEKRELEDELSVDAIALSAEAPSDDEREWGAAYLADRSAIRLYENGKSTRFRQWVVRIQNAQLEEALRAHRIDYSPSREVVEILTAERIRSSGEVIQASQVSDEGEDGKVGGMYLDQRYKLIVFDDLEAGDVVHIRYRVESVGDNIFGGFFGDIEGVMAAVPKRNVLYGVIAPERIPLFASGIRTGRPERTKRGSDIMLTWRFDEVDGLELEPHPPAYPDLGMLVSVTTYETWSQLGLWYAGLFREQLELDEAARAGAKAAIAGAKDERAIIERLYNYVVKNTRYVGIELGIHGWKPFKASEVHRRRYGDCKDKSTLLAALLRDNGIDATLTLVRTSDRGRLPSDHATMWAFNHAITYVPKLDLFLDPTAEFSGSRELPYLDQGAMALVVHPDGRTKLLTLGESRAEDNLNRSTYVATFAKDGGLVLDGVERFFGARASSLRQEFEEVEQRRKRLEEQLSDVFTGVSVARAEFTDLADLEAPVEYRYVATVPRYGKLEEGVLSIPVALFRHEVAGTYAKLAERRTTLTITHPWSTQNVIRYRLPEGARVVELPESVTIDTEHIRLEQLVRKTEDGFETDDTVTMKSKQIQVEDYAEFREGCLAIDRALARKVVIAW